jgi:hypothetical protein
VVVVGCDSVVAILIFPGAEEAVAALLLDKMI